MLHVLTYAVSYKLFWDWIGVVRFVSKRYNLTKGLLFHTFFINNWNQLCRCEVKIAFSIAQKEQCSSFVWNSQGALQSCILTEVSNSNLLIVVQRDILYIS